MAYMVCLLSCPRARQLYRTESLHPPGHPVTAAVLRETEETLTQYLSEIVTHFF
jgi:hypothetical protein